MESNYQDQVDMSQTADGFMVLSRIEALRVQIDESKDELDTLKQEPNANPKDIELLQECVRINLELLDLLEAADQKLYNEIELLNE